MCAGRASPCGICEVLVLAGDIDHRDLVLTRSERNAGGKMMSCCSRVQVKPSVPAHLPFCIKENN